MPHSDSDRNLLFGVFALQRGFLKRDQLVDALTLWVSCKERALGEILVERGTLTLAEKLLIEQVLDRLVESHHEDSTRTLVVPSTDQPGQRSTLLGSEEQDSEPLASIERLCSNLPASFLISKGAEDLRRIPRTPSNPPTTAFTSEQRFRHVRPHASGGLGVVWLAIDQELDRTVALKEIKGPHDAELSSRSRFVREAEITGKLEHPGIVPVYSLGTRADGRPYYVMRFIEGDSLKDAIARFHDRYAKLTASQRKLQLRELLGRFLEVCNAVSYAHSRGVLHRDLKPGNIMLGPFGETLVVDWGLAKATGHADAPIVGAGDASNAAKTGGAAAAAEPPRTQLDTEASKAKPSASVGAGVSPVIRRAPVRLSLSDTEEAVTEAGSVLGTPAFMSPEQARGDIDRLGPASDVYGLGAILYTLLTGRVPAEESDLVGLLSRSEWRQPISPRRINPSVPRPLEAICLKAMAEQVEARYSTAQDLADDLKRWLADEPTMALRDPWLVRARRWARRHRSAAAAVAAALFVGISTLTWAYLRESADARKLARLNADLRIEHLRTAEARLLADRRLDRAMGAIRDYYSGVNAEVLLGRPEFGDLRKRLLERPRQFYDDLTREIEQARAPDFRERTLLAEGRFGLGHIAELTGELGIATREYQTALAHRSVLAAHDPDNLEHAERMAELYSHLGNALDASGDWQGAVDAFRNADSIYHRLAAAHPNKPKYQSGRAGTYTSLGNMARARGNLDQAAQDYRKALAIHEQLGKTNPDSAEFQNGRARTFTNLGNVLYALGDVDGSAKFCTDAIALREALLSAEPDKVEYQEGLALCYTNLGVALSAMGDQAGAADAYRKAVSLRQRLIDTHPNVPEYLYGLALSSSNLGAVLRMGSQIDQAAEAQDRAVSLYERLTQSRPEVNEYQDGLARAYSNLGIVRLAQNDPDRAQELQHKAIAVFDRLIKVQPKSPEFQEGLALAYNNLGNALTSLNRLSEAARAYENCNRIYSALASAQPDAPGHRNGRARTAFNLGNVYYAQRESTRATQQYQTASSLWEGLWAEQPNVPEYQDGLLRAAYNLAVVLAARSEYDEAAKAYQKAIGVLERQVKADPSRSDHLATLGNAWQNLAGVYQSSGRHDQAVAAMRQAIEPQRSALQVQPEALGARQTVDRHLGALSHSLRMLRRPAEAAQAARDRLALWPESPEALYRAATELAQCVELVGFDSDEGRELSARLADEAVSLVRQALQGDWPVAHIALRDPALDSLRSHPELEAMLLERLDGIWPEQPLAR